MLQKIIATLLAGALALPAQQAANLKIVVIQGEGATNSIRSHSATAPLVEVRDENDKPVSGAEVVFQLPVSGPGGYYSGWLRSQTVRTGSDGRAASSGMTPNDEPGRFNIKVTAVAGGKSGSVVIAQSNIQGANGSSTTTAGKSNNGWWKWAAVIGGAAIAGGVVAATRNGDPATVTSAASKTVTITPGVITVGVPR